MTPGGITWSPSPHSFLMKATDAVPSRYGIALLKKQPRISSGAVCFLGRTVSVFRPTRASSTCPRYVTRQVQRAALPACPRQVPLLLPVLPRRVPHLLALPAPLPSRPQGQVLLRPQERERAARLCLAGGAVVVQVPLPSAQGSPQPTQPFRPEEPEQRVLPSWF